MPESSLIAVAGERHKAHAPSFFFDRGQLQPPLEVPERVTQFAAAASAAGASWIEVHDHGLEPVLAIHDPGMVDYLKTSAPTATDEAPIVPNVFPHAAMTPARTDQQVTSPVGLPGAYCFDCSSPLYPGSWDAAYEAVQIALTAADHVGDCAAAYALCRPPGHHTGPGLYGGFCYLNSAAIAAEALTTDGLVAVLDIDIHHGNGTQAVFWDSDQVFTVSVHEHPSFGYPYYTGYTDERGDGAGEGFNQNITVSQGCEPPEYLMQLDVALEKIAAVSPHVLVVAVGFDGLEADPLSDARLDPQAYGEIGRRLRELDRHMVVIQEGGYALPVLREATYEFLVGLTS